MISTAEDLILVEQNHGVLEESNNYEEWLNIIFPLIAYDWMMMKDFAEICKTHEDFIDPGGLVTALWSLVKLAEELLLAAKFIGEINLMNLMEKIIEISKWDILFLPSLYFD